ncbi:hypothetical protein Cgig2_032071 [Carnegiea gigantea]|uniref:DUF4283 domain-containing protein n=1 Tax=Carnegiea gigantea TaxID=171969 RepID=A0A9Q1QAH6_9CARY|nr:hypothetical protein Cgig2_032071 [Carnegiea gigantea]
MGDPIPIPAIIHKTMNDWCFIKGQVDYINADNDWIMIRFTNAEDRMLVFDQRPWHMNGLNFVVKKWAPFFNSYTAVIHRIDQWVRVPRLPWEFWDQDSLTELLTPIGTMVRADQNTLLRLKSKFARVCLNTDITHPLPGSLTIAREGLSMRVPLICEGLHEKKVQDVVQKFEESTTSCISKEPSSSTNSQIPPSENWVTVFPKKRVQPAFGPRHKKMSNLKPEDPLIPTNDPIIPTIQTAPAPSNPKGIVLGNLTAMKSQDEGSPNADKLMAIDDGENEGMDEEENADIFLNLEKIEDEMCKQHDERKAGVLTYTWPPSEDLNTNYASEGLYPSKAINSNAFGPRIPKQNVYFTGIPNTCLLCIRFKETALACMVTFNKHELSTQQRPNGMKRNSLPSTRHDALYYITLIKLQPNLEYALKAYFLTKRVFKGQLLPWTKYVLPSQPLYYLALTLA